MPTLQLAIDARNAKQGAAEMQQAAQQVIQSAEKADKSVEQLNDSIGQMPLFAEEAAARVHKAGDAIGQLPLFAQEATVGITQLRTEMEKTATSSDEATKELVQLEREVQKVGDNMDATSADAAQLEQRLQKLDAAMTFVRRTIIGLVGGFSALYAIRQTFRMIAEFEQGLAGVAKTTDLAGADLDKFSASIDRMSVDLGESTGTLLEIAQAAGQLGVKGADNLEKFTETVAKLGTATDLRGSEAATTLARMLNVTGEAVESVDVLGSVIVKLGNNVAATESEIAHHSQQVALATAVYKLGSANAAALGATLAEMGLRAELSGSAIGRVLRAMDATIRENGDNMKLLSRITGQTADDIKKQFETDAAQGLLSFLKGLGAIIEEGGDARAILEQFGLEGEEILKVIPSLSLNAERFARNLGLVQDELKNVTSLDQEFNRWMDTIGKQFAQARNASVVLAKSWAMELAPAAEVVIHTVRELIDPTFEAEGAARQLANGIRFLTEAAIIFMSIKLISYIGMLPLAIEAVTIAVRSLTAAIAANPFGLIAVGISAALAYLIDWNREVEVGAPKVEQYNEQLAAMDRHYKSIAAGRAQYQSGLADNNLEQQAQGLRRQIDSLEESVRRMREAGMTRGDSSWTFFGDFISEISDPAIIETAKNQAIANLKSAQEGIQYQIDKYQSENDFLQQYGGLAGQAIVKANEDMVRELGIQLRNLDLDDMLINTNLLALTEDELARLKAEFDKVQSGIKQNPIELLDQKEQDRVEQAREQLAGFMHDLQLQRRLIGRSEEDQAVIIAMDRAISMAKAAKEPYLLYAAAVARAVRENFQLKEAADKSKDALKKQEDVVKSINEQIGEVQRQTKYALLPEKERANAIALAKAVEELNQSFANGNGDLTKRDELIRQLTESYDQLTEAQRKAAEQEAQRKKQEDDARKAGEAYRQFHDNLKRMRVEIDSLGEINQLRREQGLTYTEARDRVLALAQAEEQLKKIYDESPAGLAARQAKLRELADTYDELREMEKLHAIADGVGQAFGTALEDIALNAKNVGDVIRDLANDIQRLLFRQLVTQQFTNALSGAIMGAFAPSARGNLFSGGNIVPFANGGLVSEPTMFPMNDGRTGIMGEAGDELVMPAVRDRSGRLGVKAVGGSGGSVNVTMHIHGVRNVDEFRSAKGHILAELGSGLRRVGR